MEKQAIIASLLRDDIARKIQNAKNGMRVSDDTELLGIWHQWADHVVKQQLTLIQNEKDLENRYSELEAFFRTEASDNLRLKESNKGLADTLAKYEQVNAELQRRLSEQKGN